ncbi:1-acyl-sn-glycerol-3-phosphate acyltransferase [Erythrobacter litoralis]|uniref:lysophospholipid acyltransferase family protein n=1 Tax=Erythrobacter litoralis TaxID=39960 RepID=UPI0024352373|nr:lysophospholipid acyltransferase family protein [Erythrobacter litoralis]MDG6079300.1 1-acyl-sn-glycerol-3-phosphate acyltransferase [Erythrobacter litoralis]
MIYLRNAAFYGAFYFGSVFVTLAALACLPFSRAAFRRRVENWSGMQRWCVRHLLGCPVRIENQPPQRPVLYAVKHESFFEAIDAPTLFDTPAVFAKKELFDIPFWGRAALAYGLVPVSRGDGAKTLKAMIRAAKEAVSEGRPLVIFPEGTRVPHGERAELKAGFAGLYKLLGLPVIPVAVNSGPPYHRGLKRRDPITYRFGEEIPPGLPRDEIETRVLDAINALN